jgi:hypothetical protein
LSSQEEVEDLFRWLGQGEVDPFQASGIAVSILLVVLTFFCATSAEERDRVRLLVLGSVCKQVDEERGRRA